MQLLLTSGRRRPPLLRLLSNLAAHATFLTSSQARLLDLRLDAINLLLLGVLLLLATRLDSALPAVSCFLVATRSSRVSLITE